MSLEISAFKSLNLNDQTSMLCKHMPTGLVWSNVWNSDTNIGKLIIALSVEFYRLNLMLEETSNEIDIDQTFKLIEEWETSTGLPRSLFNVFGNDLDFRRTNIKYLLTNFWGVQVAADFERVALYYGYDVEVYPGTYYGAFPLSFPVMFFDSTKTIKYTIVVKTNIGEDDSYFPLEFPLPFTDGGTTFLKNLFEILAPANCLVLVTNLAP